MKMLFITRRDRVVKLKTLRLRSTTLNISPKGAVCFRLRYSLPGLSGEARAERLPSAGLAGRKRAVFFEAGKPEEGQKPRKAPRGRKLRLRKGCAYLFRIPRVPGKAALAPVRRAQKGKRLFYVDNEIHFQYRNKKGRAAAHVVRQGLFSGSPGRFSCFRGNFFRSLSAP